MSMSLVAFAVDCVIFDLPSPGLLPFECGIILESWGDLTLFAYSIQ